MTCELKEYIYIFKGDDTNWNNEQFLTVNITSQTIDLSTMTAKFILGSFSQTFPLTTGSFEINLSKAVTGAYSFGPINGVIQILDSQSRVKTASNTIPFYVTNKVQDAQNATFDVQVSENSPIEIDIKVGGGGGGGSSEWGQITGTLSDQTDLQDALNAKMNTSGGTFTGNVDLASGVSLNTQVGQIHDVNGNVVLGGKGTNYGLYVAPDGTAAALVGNGTLKDIVTTADVKSTYSATGTDPVNGTAVASALSPISAVIPSAATSQNQLADKNFVNSSVSTNTANFIGTFNSVTDLESYSGTVTNNDYAFVINSVVTDNGGDWANTTDLNAYDKTLLTNFDYAWVVNDSKFDLYRFNIVNQTWELRAQDIHKDTSLLNTAYNRYKATVSGSTVTWGYEYTLNNSSFTADQWAAINSGANTTNIGQIATNTTAIAAKQPKTLDTPITVGGVSQTTVESALGAINTNTDGALKNKTTASNSLNILGAGTLTHTNAVAIGVSATQKQDSVAVGYGANCVDTYSVALGRGATATQYCVSVGYGASTGGGASRGIAIGYAANANAANAIQLGQATNSTASTFQVYSYPMLDGTTGKIPMARLPIVQISQADYDALVLAGTVDADTLYLIV